MLSESRIKWAAVIVQAGGLTLAIFGEWRWAYIAVSVAFVCWLMPSRAWR